MTQEIASSIIAIIVVCIFIIVFVLTMIFEIKKDILKNNKTKEFCKNLTTEQKALIHDYEQCKKVNVFKKEDK